MTKERFKSEIIKKMEAKGFFVQETNVVKMNENYDGLIFKEGDRDNVGVILDLDQSFEKYCVGISVDTIIQEVLGNNKHFKYEENMDAVFDWNYVHDKLFLSVCNKVVNGTYLLDKVYEVYASDLAVVAKILISEEDEEYASVTVTQQMLKLYGISQEELFRAARVSSANLMPVEYISVLMDDILDTKFFAIRGKKIAGAAAIFYEGEMERIREFIEGDYYLIPSSTMEMIVFPKTGTESFASNMKKNIREVNENCVSPDIQLSDSLYLYSQNRLIKVNEVPSND